MRRKISLFILMFFLSSIVLWTYAATDNVIVRVGYPRLGENQYVGTVRIYESENTIDSIQLGDIFTIFVENAEFMSPPTLIERGRFDLDVISGGEDGDSYITYEFIEPVPADPERTGRVIIDFAFDDMRVLGGDVTARVDSLQANVTSGYFSLYGTEEEEKEELKEETVKITSLQIQEAIRLGVNIIIQNDDYQILLPNKLLLEESISSITKSGESLEVKVVQEESTDSRYLTDVYEISFKILDEEDNVKATIESFQNDFLLKIKDEDILDKPSTRGAIIEDAKLVLLPTHYDGINDYIMIMVRDISDKITGVRAFNTRQLNFEEGIGGFVLENNIKYIPLRQSAVYYDWEVTWNPFTRTVVLQKDDKQIEVRDYIIVRERSYVTTDFIKEQLEVPVFHLNNQVVLKKYY